jgi:hypothetical protein
LTDLPHSCGAPRCHTASGLPLTGRAAHAEPHHPKPRTYPTRRPPSAGPRASYCLAQRKTRSEARSASLHTQQIGSRGNPLGVPPAMGRSASWEATNQLSCPWSSSLVVAGCPWGNYLSVRWECRPSEAVESGADSGGVVNFSFVAISQHRDLMFICCLIKETDTGLRWGEGSPWREDP